MNVHVSSTDPRYQIAVQDLEGRVTLYRDDVILASSTNAKVMYETRLPKVIYVPPEDFLIDLTEMSNLKTFCPFKGTARYRGLKLPEGTLENAVWFYDKTLPESRAVEGLIGLSSQVYTHLDVGANEFASAHDPNMGGPLVDWLFRDAPSLASPEEFTRAFAERLLAQNIPVSRLAVMIWSLHPQIAANNIIWERGKEELNTFAPTYEIHDHPSYLNSPLRHVSNGLGGVRQRLDDPHADASFPIIEDLRALGATDYVAMPLPFSDGRRNVLTLTSDHPDGFSTEDLGTIFEAIFVVSRFYEVFTQRMNAQSLLETYVGKRSGARVLGGEIRRGDGDEIDAAIMFCDLRGSTRLEEELGRRAYIALLNRFFETVSNVVHDHGGEVLKFIGDAVLAVFPDNHDSIKASAQSVDAAKEIIRQIDLWRADVPDVDIDVVLGLDFGRVTYGNVGSSERLDFTVIGQAANISARLADHAKTTPHRILVSDAVAKCCEGLVDMGEVSLHNVSRPVTCFASA
jgi:adenylate cyclase